MWLSINGTLSLRDEVDVRSHGLSTSLAQVTRLGTRTTARGAKWQARAAEEARPQPGAKASAWRGRCRRSFVPRRVEMSRRLRAAGLTSAPVAGAGALGHLLRR